MGSRYKTILSQRGPLNPVTKHETEELSNMPIERVHMQLFTQTKQFSGNSEHSFIVKFLKSVKNNSSGNIAN